ncbi:MAG TPA: SPOR domain-containing protein [Vicinamibacterales bacterium]|nr:SPOR domain-containing protein [Vicinamibacterales bacterium]
MTDLSHDGAEDGFHEIQLSGKQLVFLFMATTVVSVVIFLCGVLVGRGVRGDTVNAAEQTTATPAAPPVETTPVAEAGGTPTPAGDDPSGLSYPDTLKRDKAPDTFKPKDSKVADAAPPRIEETPPPAPASGSEAKPVATPTPRTTPAANGKPLPGIWAVQVVALSDRAAANAVVQRLQAKNYPAFVVDPPPNAPVQTYKVQVGKFGDRSEAEQVKNRLKKEEQFEPIIRR